MPRMQYGLSAFKRAKGDLPELPVINMYAEAAPTEEAGVVLQSREGFLDRGSDMGAGPVQALFKGDGVLDSSLYGVSGATLYREAVSIGALDGPGPFSMAGYENYLFSCGGESIWTYDGVTLAALSFPDGANVVKVLVGASRLVALRSDTEKVYWSDPLASTVTALNFASAENQPDRLRDMLFIDDLLVLFGAETVEIWANTPDATLPFQPIEGRVMERGIKNTGAAAKFGSSFAWVTQNNEICVGDQDQVISNPGLEAEIAQSSRAYLFTFQIGGTDFLGVRLESGTWVVNKRSGTFSNFQTYGGATWTPSCFAGDVFGSATDGTTYALSGYIDEGGVLERRFRAGFPLNGGAVTINNIMLRCNVGGTDYLTGDYADPDVELRLSRDGGKTWGEWRSASLGAQGNYRQKVMWPGLGMASYPGLLAEFRVTAPIDFRVSDVLFNEPFGGV